jgi:tRNA(Ile)-lysidine synthetase-like protein
VFGRWVLEARLESERPTPRPIGRLVVLLPPAEALEVRCARPGETLAVRGGAKRVVEVLREAGVPARLRPQWPVLTADGRMAWVVGVRAAESTLPEAGPMLLVTARKESP